MTGHCCLNATHILLKIAQKMLFGNPIEFAHMTLFLVPKVLYAAVVLLTLTKAAAVRAVEPDTKWSYGDLWCMRSE